MNYIRITRDNIDREHICCAMSGKQSLRKKEWLKQRLEEGLVFCRSEERGKCFIEYLPTENAWVPIRAEGYLYINCLWIAGAMKGHGYANDLLAECSRDAEAQGRKGICILSAQGRKREFLSDPKFLAHKGFQTADVSDCGISLLYLPLAPDARTPGRRSSGTAPNTRKPRRTGSFSTTPISVPIPATGCPGCRRPRGSTASPCGSSTSRAGRRPSACPRRSPPTPCSGTADS